MRSGSEAQKRRILSDIHFFYTNLLHFFPTCNIMHFLLQGDHEIPMTKFKDNYRPRSRGDHTFGSVRLSVRLSVLSQLSTGAEWSATLLKTSLSVHL